MGYFEKNGIAALLAIVLLTLSIFTLFITPKEDRKVALNHYPAYFVLLVSSLLCAFVALSKEINLPGIKWIFGEPDKGLSETIVHLQPSDPAIWSNSYNKFIWFNAQYQNAVNQHPDSHFKLMLDNNVKFELILIQPISRQGNDFNNFKEKFQDMRKFLKKLFASSKTKNVIINDRFQNIYLLKEDKTPSLSFFLTEDEDKENRAIIYIEDPQLIDNHRRPTMSFETRNTGLIAKLIDRYKFAVEKNPTSKKLSFDELISDLPDSDFYLK
jgi:hypothetical protein